MLNNSKHKVINQVEPVISEKEIYNRTELLIGERAIERLGQVRVIIFGVGGVGSWCAEGLVRSGVTRLTLVDSDTIAPSNVNRQAMATTLTIGQAKVEALRARLLDINPNAEIVALQKVYSKHTAHEFNLSEYDYIVDAIDSIGSKMHLILEATAKDAVFFSSMGAALKLDPTRVRVAEFWDVKGCPLGSIIRKRIKRLGMPAKKFLCVYSDEVLDNQGTANCKTERTDTDIDWNALKAQINGTCVVAVSTFGFTLASLIIRDAISNSQ